MSTPRVLILLSAFFLSLTIGWFSFSALLPHRNEVEFHANYGAISRAEMFDQADAIFAGQVVSIAPARWNQDSGEYWQDKNYATLPYHELVVRVEQPMRDKIGLQSQVTLTILGGSPTGTIQSGTVAIAPKPDHTLSVGDRVLFFVVQLLSCESRQSSGKPNFISVVNPKNDMISFKGIFCSVAT